MYFVWENYFQGLEGLLTVLLCGANGEAYNIASAKCDVRLKDLAQTIASEAGVQVVFDIPNATEQAGFSKATKARLSAAKLQALSWIAKYDIHAGIARTLAMMRETL